MTDTSRELAELRTLIPPEEPRHTIWFAGAPLDVTPTQQAWLSRLTEGRNLEIRADS